MTPLLQLEDVHAYYGHSHVLHGVTLHVQAGETVSLLGRNGSGRSTTLRAVMGLVRTHGRMSWRGQSCAGWPPFQRARAGLGYVPESRDVFAALTVQQNLVLGCKRPAPHRPSVWTVDALVDLFPRLKARWNTAAGVLSGGEQQLLSLCRTALGHPDLMMVDEPTEGLSPQWIEQVGQFLQYQRERGVALLLVEKKLNLTLQLATRCCVLGQGRVVFDGHPAQLRDNRAVQREWLAV